jgi:hypothetical protein
MLSRSPFSSAFHVEGRRDTHSQIARWIAVGGNLSVVCGAVQAGAKFCRMLYSDSGT